MNNFTVVILWKTLICEFDLRRENVIRNLREARLRLEILPAVLSRASPGSCDPFSMLWAS